MAFNMMELLNKHSKEKEENQNISTSDQEPESFEIKMLDVYDLIPSKDNFYSVDKIEDMKQSIELLGIEQNLIVKEEDNTYTVLAGHCRRLASMALVKEGKEKYRYAPCRIKRNENALMNRLTMLMTNSTARDLSDWEKMKQSIEIEAVVIELKKELDISGNTREILSEIIKIKPTQLARYKAIYNNLDKILMDEFKAEHIGYSVANKVSGLSTKWQQAAAKLLKVNGSLSLNDIDELKRKEESAKPAPGQMTIQESKGGDIQICEKAVEPTTVLLPIHSNIDQQQKVENVSNLDNKKLPTIFKYLDEPKTLRADNLQEVHNVVIQNSEKQKNITNTPLMDTSGIRKPITHDVKIANMHFDEVATGRKTFELRKNDRGYKVNDFLMMDEFKNGERTNRAIKAVIIYILEDYEGIKDDYCILGIAIKEVKGI